MSACNHSVLLRFRHHVEHASLCYAHRVAQSHLAGISLSCMGRHVTVGGFEPNQWSSHCRMNCMTLVQSICNGTSESGTSRSAAEVQLLMLVLHRQAAQQLSSRAADEPPVVGPLPQKIHLRRQKLHLRNGWARSVSEMQFLTHGQHASVLH